MSPFGDNKTWMETIGTGFRMVGDRLLVRLTTVPEINTSVYGDEGKQIGKIVDIIGPVKSPFGVVATMGGYNYQGKTISVKSQ